MGDLLDWAKRERLNLLVGGRIRKEKKESLITAVRVMKVH